MASVDFMKLHGATETKARMAHCDKEERAKHEHTNKDIRKDLIATNVQLKRSYSETCQAYDDRIASLDACEGANKRKDRVTCFGLEIPFPADLDASKGIEWSSKVLTLIQRQYGSENLMQGYIHRDEVHDYVDAETGEKRTSRNHIHVFVVPEHNGKLNGKWFSSKSNMTKLNNSIQAMTRDDYGCDFMDGTKRKSKAEVEDLKNKSQYKALEADLRAQYDRKADLLAKEQENALKTILERSRLLDEREEKLDEREKALDRRAKLLDRADLSSKVTSKMEQPIKHRGENVFDFT